MSPIDSFHVVFMWMTHVSLLTISVHPICPRTEVMEWKRRHKVRVRDMLCLTSKEDMVWRERY